MTIPELAEAVSAAERLDVVGSDSKRDYRNPIAGGAERLELSALNGIEHLWPDDLVVSVLAGTLIADLQDELKLAGLRLALPLRERGGTVGGMLACNLPHALWAQCGGPRDWLLGCTVVRANGEVAKSGSRVVKSVAGYDAHKLMVGSRGCLGVIAQAYLRLWPVNTTGRTEYERMREDPGGPMAITRALPSQFSAIRDEARDRMLAVDSAGKTLWYQPPVVEIGEGSWTVTRGMGVNWRIGKGQPRRLVRAARERLDPTSKLNPGEFEAAM